MRLKDGEITIKVDVWSLGLIFMDILTGIPRRMLSKIFGKHIDDIRQI
jgi:serine/threonine protein kinase